MRWILGLITVAASACGSLTAPTHATYTGHWTGQFVVRQCVPVGFVACEGTEAIGSIHTIDLSLVQNGTTVSGTLQVTESPAHTMNVTGTVSQNVLTLSGEYSDSIINRVSFYRLGTTQWSTSVDDSGRMTGTFGLHHSWTWGSGSMRPVGETWTLDQDAELANVARALSHEPQVTLFPAVRGGSA